MAVSQRLLAMGALTVAAFMATIATLPASAEIVAEQTVVVPTQSFRADEIPQEKMTAAAPAAAALREDLSVSAYSVVNYPLPAGTTISSGFGYRIPPCSGCSSYHKGVDLLGGAGNGIHAIADGTVTEVSTGSGGLGVYVVIDHVIDGEHVSSLYGHMAYGSLSLSVGDKVVGKQVVGQVGSTGQSTGPHLYFEIRLGGTRAINPMPWLAAHVNA
ncbi:M23 family metallopeptidase [Glaciihabitans arcticus]|uniref:M23 family metallopeptidase n=1 Tax=Glaciihabitans arcticus TaxID=2668039 RepID=A0A4Q9GU74_9MICO|nr:M23 family metallopeptidase [Glaciihabitans arcticus]TBN57168.1 M23 family metallopeptidase [Glaciihabitans arcticus]